MLRESGPAFTPKWQRPEILEAVFDQLSDALFYDKDLLTRDTLRYKVKKFNLL